jgi:lipopolysaccharide export system permease protein
MKAAGIPLQRLVIPVVVVGGLLSGLCFYLQDRAQPAAVQKMNRLLYTELPQRITLEVLPTGVMHEVAGWRIYIGSRDAGTKTLNDVVILQPKGGSDWVYYAESARFIETDQGLRMYMNRGNLVLPQEGDSVASVPFSDVTLSLPQNALKTPPSPRRAQRLQLLWAREAEAAATYRVSPSRQSEEDLRKIREEICDRLSLPLACLAVSFLAAPLAVRAPRAGRTYSFAIGLAIVGVYYLLRLEVQPSTVQPFGEMLTRAMIPNVALCASGLIALWRVDRV